jgi:hypothetical protein
VKCPTSRALKLVGVIVSREFLLPHLHTASMATEGTPARKLRRIVDDDDDSDGDLPAITDPSFLHPKKAVTPEANQQDGPDAGGLFSDDDDDESPSGKRYVLMMTS